MAEQNSGLIEGKLPQKNEVALALEIRERENLSDFIASLFSRLDQRVGSMIGFEGNIFDQIPNSLDERGDIRISEIDSRLHPYTSAESFKYSNKGILYEIENNGSINFRTDTPNGSFELKVVRGGQRKGFETVFAERVSLDEDGNFLGGLSVRTFTASSNPQGPDTPLVLGQRSKRNQQIELEYNFDPSKNNGGEVDLANGQRVHIVNFQGLPSEYIGTFKANDPQFIIWEKKVKSMDARYPAPETTPDVEGNIVIDTRGYDGDRFIFPVRTNIYGQLKSIVEDILPSQTLSPDQQERATNALPNLVKK